MKPKYINFIAQKEIDMYDETSIFPIEFKIELSDAPLSNSYNHRLNTLNTNLPFEIRLDEISFNEIGFSKTGLIEATLQQVDDFCNYDLLVSAPKKDSFSRPLKDYERDFVNTTQIIKNRFD